MSDAVIVALITGGLAFAGVLVNGFFTYNKMQTQVDKQLAVMNTKLEELTREVRRHNGFAERMPVVEEKIKVVNRRLDDLEKGV